jgi:hypothetical protein
MLPYHELNHDLAKGKADFLRGEESGDSLSNAPEC